MIGLRTGLKVGNDDEPQGVDGPVDHCSLAVAINDSADPVAGTSNFNYTVVATVSSHTATSLQVDVQLDASLTYVSGSGTGWTVTDLGSGHIRATRASGAVGAQPTITITVTPTNADATISSTADCNASNATAPATQASQSTVITGQATLSINSFTDSADPVITLDAYSYTVQVRNTHASNTASSITALVTIPANATFVSASGTGWTCNQSGGVVTCTRVSLAASTNAPNITVNVTAASAGETSSATASASASNAPATGNSTQTTVIKFVTRDGTATTKFFPANSTEFQALIDCNGLAISVPSRGWGCQDSSGNLAAKIGSTVLTAAGTPNYAQAITGLTRVGVQGRDNTSDQFAMASGVGPNPSSTSVAWLVVAKMPSSPAATRTDFFGNNIASATQEAKVTHSSTGVLIDRCVGVATNGTTSVSGNLSCFAKVYDRTNSASITYDATGDKIVGAFASGVVDGAKGLARGCAAIFADVYQWEGAAAEALTSTNMKALMTALGWGTPSWS